MAKPKIGIFKFASCDGCQLSLLNLETELLAIAAEVDIAYFPEASSLMCEGPYDIALIEGSLTTQADIERLHLIRKDSKYLITIGACSSTGGIQALRNWADVGEYTRLVYASPAYIKTLKESTSVAEHVGVDFSISGCPIEKRQLAEVITALLIGRAPELPSYAVCMDCKRAGNTCVLVAKDAPCLGPVTQAGCGAICPSYNRGCFGCFGPMESANPESLINTLQQRGIPNREIQHLLRGFTANAEKFRLAGERLEETR